MTTLASSVADLEVEILAALEKSGLSMVRAARLTNEFKKLHYLHMLSRPLMAELVETAIDDMLKLNLDPPLVAERIIERMKRYD
jgi:nucleoside diphosphate kinase